MKNYANHATGSIGFSGLLGIAFIILKLCGVISWRWLWVLAPLWGTLVLYILVAAVLFILSR